MQTLKQPQGSNECLVYAFAMVTDLSPELIRNCLGNHHSDLIETLYRVYGLAFVDLPAYRGYVGEEVLHKSDLSWVFQEKKAVIILERVGSMDHAVAWCLPNLHDPATGLVGALDMAKESIGAVYILAPTKN
jgi:hypothetical protein